MPALTKEMITPGLHIWMPQFDYKLEPMEFIIITGEVGEFNKMFVTPVDKTKEHGYEVNGRDVVYLGDMGVAGYAYNKRAPRIFTTREDLEAAIKMWAGRHPNTIDSEGNPFK